MYKRFVPLLLLSVCLHLHAVDSDIRILTIFTPQYAANEGVEKLNLEITALIDTWQNSGLFGSAALLWVGAEQQSLIEGQSEMANFAEMQTGSVVTARRDFYQADIVVKLAWDVAWSGEDNCGSVKPGTGLLSLGFHPDATGLDLTSYDDGHMVLVESSGCAADTVAHEVGHVLGGSHEGSGNGGAFWFSNAVVALTFKTMIADADCPYPYCIGCLFENCTVVEDYSRDGLQRMGESLGNLANTNTSTFHKTAASVANYWQGEPPSCSLSMPVNLQGNFLFCSDPYYTHHVIDWTDPCEDAPDSWKVYAEQPAGIGYYELKYTTVVKPSLFYLWGDPANIKIVACDGTTCSNPSGEYYYADNRCGAN